MLYDLGSKFLDHCPKSLDCFTDRKYCFVIVMEELFEVTETTQILGIKLFQIHRNFLLKNMNDSTY